MNSDGRRSTLGLHVPDGLDKELLRQAVEEAGYQVAGMKNK